MLCKCYWIVLYTVHFTAFCLGGPFFPRTRCIKITKKYSKEYPGITKQHIIKHLFDMKNN